MPEEQKDYKIEDRPSTIFRIMHNPDNPYVVVDVRPILNCGLSWKAKGILVYLLSRPDGWEVNLADLTNRSTDGLAAVKSGCKELKEAGHLKHAGVRKASGQFETVIWEVYEAPQVGNQLTDKPQVGVDPEVDFPSPQVDCPQAEKPRAVNSTQVLKTLSSNDSKKKIANSKIKDLMPVGSDPMWVAMHGGTEEEIAADITEQARISEIINCYESSMGYNPLPWGNRSFERLMKFLITKSVDEIKTFASWCRQPYSQLSPSKARQNPEMVVDLWPQVFPKPVIPVQPRKPGEGFYG